MQRRYLKFLLASFILSLKRSGNSSVRVATGYEMDDRVQEFFSLLHSVQSSTGAHSASYPMDSGGSFPGGKAARE
jgi:hypothetical protein